jgi:death-on-curing protein
MNSPTDKPVRYLTYSDLFNINHTVTNGDTFVRDMHLLQSAVKRPALQVFGEPQFPTLLDKAAALIHSLAYHHLFADGNKRTAVQAVTMFLELNGYEVTWKYDTEYPFILEVAQGKHDVEAIAEWLTAYVQPVAG